MPRTQGAFETIGAFASGLPLWRRHLHRLRRAAARLDLPWHLPRGLRASALALLHHNGHGVLRLALECSPQGGVRLVMTTRARDREREPLRVLAAPTARPAAWHDDLKCCRRTALDAWRAQARAAGAHDALLWRDGQLLEATAYNVLVVVGGRLRTPPADGTILPGIARGALCAALSIDEAPVSLAALSASPLVVLTNAVYGPRLARVGAGGAAPPSHPLLARLRAAWRAVTAAKA